MGRKKKQKTVVDFILDMSGSMSSVYESTISGYNEYLGTLKKEATDMEFALTLFDDVIEGGSFMPIKDVPELTEKSYTPRGMTALYDAVCTTVLETEKEFKDEDVKHLVVVLTDGFENSSKEFNEKSMRELIKRLEKTDKWSFVYLGANQDAWAVAQNYGFAPSNVATFNASAKGVEKTFGVLTRNTMMYSSGSLEPQSYFSASDQETLQGTL